MTTCREASEMISSGQDARLTMMSRISLYAHLAICQACRRFRRQVRAIERRVRSDGGSQGHLDEAARQRIRAAMRRE